MLKTETVDVRLFKHDEGCQAHLVIDPESKQAVVIDPRLDQVDEILEAAKAAGATVTYALDTHTHADHLSGVRFLASRSGAKLLASAASKMADADERLEPGGKVALGGMSIEAIAAPGHTVDSLALLIGGRLFTGDALFAGGAGRTDFKGGSASDLFDTMGRFKALPDETVVHPGHNYTGKAETTIGEERGSNPLMKEEDRKAFVARLDVKGPRPAGMMEILDFNIGGPGKESVLPRELKSLGKGVPVVDVRSASEYSADRIADAIHIPLENLESRLDEIPGDGDVVLVCRTGIRASDARKRLEKAGRKARVLEGGLVAWKRAGLPTEGHGGLSVERQVQLVSGSFIFAGTLLGVFVNPWFLVIPGFFGAGLAFAGASGTCGMGVLLSKMPWNRGGAEASSGAACAAGASACAVGGKTPEN